MPAEPFSALACPLDGHPLEQQEKCWVCSDGHSFDVARQGYVHLLPVQNKRSKEPGDSKEMVAARQRFLAEGYYRSLADEIARLVLEDVSADGETLPSLGLLNCLDAGCGEGYYLRHLAAASDRPLSLAGIDISKWAVRSAAVQAKNARWIVATNAHLPVQDSTVDSVLCLFGFPVYSEFRRVLKTGGRLILADAGNDHLRELRDVVYDQIKPARPHSELVPEGFVIVQRVDLRKTLQIPDREVIGDLLAMTPHLYRAKPDGLARAEALCELTVTLDVRITVLEAL